MNWGIDVSADAPTPSNIPDFVLKFHNDMGHLEFYSELDYGSYLKLYKLVMPYINREVRQFYVLHDKYILSYYKPYNGVPMKHNVSVLLDGSWKTVCLDYTGLDYHIVED
jgi:hypothetical protein